MRTLVMRFQPAFHKAYNGVPVDVRFKISAARFMRPAHAINRVSNKMFSEILFPDKVRRVTAAISD
jgi:hypothetical protein